MDEKKLHENGEQESWNYEKKGHTGYLTFINKPRNFLSIENLAEFDKKLDKIKMDRALRVLVIKSGISGVFISGEDFDNLNENPGEIKEYNQFFKGIIEKLENLDIPVISAIDGYCLGGGIEFALASDISIATRISRFGQPEILYGMMPGSGRIRHLSRILSKNQVKRLLLTGFSLSAEEAFQLGLVGEIVVQGKLEQNLERITERLCSLSPLAVSLVKKSINQQYDAYKLELESPDFDTISKREDLEEGLSSYLNGRAPH